MSRCLLFSIFVLCVIGRALGTCSKYKHCNKHHKKPLTNLGQTYFYEVAGLISQADELLQSACKKDDVNVIKEKFDSSSYTLVMKLNVDSEVNVQRRHRVLMIEVLNKEETSSFLEVKVLPQGVDEKTGFWNVDGGELTIYFLYKQGQNYLCSEKIDTTTTIVPNMSVDGTGLLEERFGNIS